MVLRSRIGTLRIGLLLAFCCGQCSPSPRPPTSRPTTSRPTTSRPTTSRPTTPRPPTSRPATSRPTTSPRGTAAGKDGIPDIPDRCPILLDCDDGFHIDSDGCPDPVITLERKSLVPTAASARLLAELVQEIAGLKGRLQHLRLVGYVAPGGSEAEGLRLAREVLQWLVKRGVPATILEAVGRRASRGTDVYVALDVVSCNGKPSPRSPRRP